MRVTLGEIADVTMGQSPKSSFYNDEGLGTPFLQGTRTFGRYYPLIDTFTTKVTKMAKSGDILMSVRAPVGVINITPVDLCIGRGLCAIRGKNINHKFLYYLLKYSVPKLENSSNGTVFSSVNKRDICELDLEIPSDENQIKIAHILECLDTKIQINERINKNLDEQIQTIFQEKFLSCGCLPLGWKKVTLGEVADISAGGDKPKNVLDHKTKEYKYPIYSNSISDEGLYGFTTGYKINQESVTVSARGTIGFVCIRHFPYTPIVRLITLVPNTSNISAKYLYLWLKSIHIQGTGTTQQQLTVPDFKRTEIFIPSALEMNEFTETVDPLFLKIWKNQEENVRLESIRDTLLPRLLTGELDLSYAVI